MTLKLRLSILAVAALCLILPVQAQPAAQSATEAAAPIPLNAPQGLALDVHGNLYVANSGSNQILVYNRELVQQPSLTITIGLDNPTRLAFDSLGNLYVANSGGNSITVYDENLNQIMGKTITSVTFPLGVAVDAYDDVYVAENSANDVKVFNTDGGLVETLSRDSSGRSFSAPGALAIQGMNLYVGTGPSAGQNDVTSYNAGEFLANNTKEITTYTNNINTGPTGIAFDTAGNVYVSDFYSNTATKYSPTGELLLVINNQTDHCEGIAVTQQGNIAVSNESANTITIYGPDGTLLHTLH